MPPAALFTFLLTVIVVIQLCVFCVLAVAAAAAGSGRASDADLHPFSVSLLTRFH